MFIDNLTSYCSSIMLLSWTQNIVLKYLKIPLELMQTSALVFFVNTTADIF